jgi:nucleoside-diphosphate-sugar epimerase
MEPADYDRFPSFDADPTPAQLEPVVLHRRPRRRPAVRLDLLWQGTGMELFVIANADTVMSRRNAALVAEVFPDVEIRRDLGEHDTLMSIDKARDLLGYRPRHSWRDTGSDSR